MYLRQLFRILFRTLNYQYDYVFDWTMLKQKAANAGSGVAPSQNATAGNTKVLSISTFLCAHIHKNTHGD